MRGRQKVVIFLLLVMIVTSCIGMFAKVSADRAASTSYILDTSTYGTFGGDNSSTSYKLTDTGGESIVGDGASGSYILKRGYQASLVKAMQLTIQPANLVGYYPMDEGSGTLLHDSSSATNEAQVRSPGSWSSGQVGGSYDFGTAQTAWAEAPAPALGTGGYTVSAWVYTAAGVSSATAVSRFGGTAGDGDWYIGQSVAGDGYVMDVYANGASVRTNGSAAPNAACINTWCQIAGSYDGTNILMYLNGVLVGNRNYPGSISSTSKSLTIGSRQTGTFGWEGKVDEVKVFNRTLTPSEVAAEYAGQAAGLQSGIGLGTVTSGVSNTANFDTIVDTDASTYDLSISSNHDLQSGAYTIPGVSGSIAVPATWTEGTTKGLGFTIFAASGLDAKWGTGTKYAAFPTSDTTFFSRSGFSGGGTKDVLNMQARVDVAASQSAGLYSAQLTVTGTVKP